MNNNDDGDIVDEDDAIVIHEDNDFDEADADDDDDSFQERERNNLIRGRRMSELFQQCLDRPDANSCAEFEALLAEEMAELERQVIANHEFRNELLREHGFDPEREDNDEEENNFFRSVGRVTLDQICQMLQQNTPHQLQKILAHDELPRREAQRKWSWDKNDATFTRIGHCMVGNTSLAEMTIEDGNAPFLTSQGVMALIHGIRQTKIHHLRLTDVRTDFQVLFFEHLVCQPSSNITSLSIYDTIRMSDLVTHLLEVPSSLSELSIGACPLTTSDVTLLMQGLGNTTIKSLRLCGCELGDAQMRALCQSWNNNSSGLEHLEFSTDVRFRPSRTQEVASNTFGPAGVRSLMMAVARQSNMKRLVLYGNHNIGYEGIAVIGEELPLSKLQQIEFQFVVEQKTHRKVTYTPQVQQIRNQAGRALADGVQNSLYLRQIDSCYFGVDAHIREEMEFYLESNHYLRSVLPNDVSAALSCHVLAAFGKNPDLVFYFLRERPCLMMASMNTI